MKKTILPAMLLLGLCLLVVSCKTPPTAPPPLHITFDGAFWTLVKTNPSSFTGRYGHTALTFNTVTGSDQDGAMWVIGGIGTTGFLKDLWFTTDTSAISWSEKTIPNASYTPRAYHSSVVYNKNMWIIGGFNSGAPSPLLNDCWSSPDGATWTQATPSVGVSPSPFPARYGHASVVFNNEMWVLGGGPGALNDVWSSTDGAVWTQAPATAPFTPRVFHGAVVFNNKMWILGGYDFGTALNDAWSSTDGSTWTQAPATKPFPARYSHTCLVYNNLMWVIGGDDVSGELNDAWFSSDGSTWTEASTSGPFTPVREAHASVVFGNHMWVLGGQSLNNAIKVLNDVWHSN